MEVLSSAMSSSTKKILSILAKDSLKLEIELFPYSVISNEY